MLAACFLFLGRIRPLFGMGLAKTRRVLAPICASLSSGCAAAAAERRHRPHFGGSPRARYNSVNAAGGRGGRECQELGAAPRAALQSSPPSALGKGKGKKNAQQSNTFRPIPFLHF